jgi:hypothetical protein
MLKAVQANSRLVPHTWTSSAFFQTSYRSQVSGFLRGVAEAFALLGSYAA